MNLKAVIDRGTTVSPPLSKGQRTTDRRLWIAAQLIVLIGVPTPITARRSREGRALPYHHLLKNMLRVGTSHESPLQVATVSCNGNMFVPAQQAVSSQTSLGVRPAPQVVLKSLIAGFFPSSSASGRAPSGQGGKPLPLDETLRQAETDFEQGRLEEALGRVREAIGLDPRSAHAYYLLGAIEAERGANEDAKQALLQSLKLDPSHIATHVSLARIYLVEKEWRGAAEEFQATIKLGDATGTGQFGLALALLAESHYSEALPHLLRAVEADPKDGERLFTLIATELQLKQVSSARRHLAEIEKLAPRDPWLSFRLGRLLGQHNMSKEAEARFERVSELLAETKDGPPPDVKLSDVYLQLARLRYDHRDYPGALQYLDKVELNSLEPDVQAQVLYLQGGTFLQTWRVSEGRDKLRQAAERSPSAPDFFIHWAWAELMAGDLKAATAAAEIAVGKWPEAPKVQELVAILKREGMPERARVPFLAAWHLKGEGLVCCPCTAPCPCRSNAPPTHGHCENTGAYRIREGHYGNIRMDGVTFAAVQGSMGLETSPLFLYADRLVTDEQLIALERIFQSSNPLRPLLFLNVKRSSVSVVRSEEDKTYEVKVPGVLELKIQRRLDGKGQPLLSTAALDFFSNTLEYAENLIYKVWNEDGNLRWDFSGRQANYRAIDLDSRDYREGTMLIRYADGSGYFTRKQLELIKNLKLPTLPSYPRPAK